MFYDGDKIAILFYAISKQVGKPPESIVTYTRFPTLSHIQHEVFLFAKAFNYLIAYDYKLGKYMPESELVDKGIFEHFVWNPIFDGYEFQGDRKTLDEAQEFIEKMPQKEKGQLIIIRDKCENFTASELYLMLHKSEVDYIKNRTIDEAMRFKIGAILDYLYYEGQYRKEAITEEVKDKLVDSFQLHYE